MTPNWYCLDCGTGIEFRESRRHATAGHHIYGMLASVSSPSTAIRRRDRETAIRPVRGADE
ncbi:hypothetical protein [Halosimplex salinum]|uniref:hypothetical protein n=1 Tax=Halosimplex salinum TaxID=1710538 RepID=UPI000F4973A7|nr:hypothetical protein [Halosimplex salinum]